MCWPGWMRCAARAGMAGCTAPGCRWMTAMAGRSRRRRILSGRPARGRFRCGWRGRSARLRRAARSRASRDCPRPRWGCRMRWCGSMRCRRGGRSLPADVRRIMQRITTAMRRGCITVLMDLWIWIRRARPILRAAVRRFFPEGVDRSARARVVFLRQAEFCRCALGTRAFEAGKRAQIWNQRQHN